MLESPDSPPSQPSRSLLEALAAFQEGDLTPTRVSRLSDLSRAEARELAKTWHSIPETTRAELVRRCNTLSEERIDVNFRRALRVALADSSPVVRQLAIDALWEDESTEHMDQLLALMRDDVSPDVRASAAVGLERFAGRAVAGEVDAARVSNLRAALVHATRDSASPYGLQRKALEALGPFGADRPVGSLIDDAYASADHGLQCSALYAMGRSLQARWLPIILTELASEEPELRFEAARAAGALGTPDALPALLEAAHDEDVEVRQAAIAAIGHVGGRGALRALERLTEDAGEADLELIESTIDDVNALLEPFETP